MRHYITEYAKTLCPETSLLFDRDFKNLVSGTQADLDSLSERYGISLKYFDKTKKEAVERIAFIIFEKLYFKNHIIGKADWEGDVENSLSVVTQNALNKMGLELNVSKLLDEWHKKLDMKNIGAGDYIQQKFIHVSDILVANDLCLTFIETKNDFYCFSVINNAQKQHLNKYYNEQYEHFLYDCEMLKTIQNNPIKHTETYQSLESMLLNQQESTKKLQTEIINKMSLNLKKSERFKWFSIDSLYIYLFVFILIGATMEIWALFGL